MKQSEYIKKIIDQKVGNRRSDYSINSLRSNGQGVIIPPATKLGGVYWNHPVLLSVRLSVCLSVCPSVRL